MKDIVPAGIQKRYKADMYDAYNILRRMAYLCVILGFLGMFSLILGALDEKDPNPIYAQIFFIFFIIFFPTLIFIILGSRFYYYGRYHEKYGRTPGERYIGIKTVDFKTGEKLSFRRAGLRAIFPPGYMVTFFNKDKRALNDYIFSTRVIDVKKTTDSNG